MRMRWWPPAMLFIGLSLMVFGKGALDVRLMLMGGALVLNRVARVAHL